METPKLSTSDFIRSLSILHLAMMIGQLLFSFIVLFLIFQNDLVEVIISDSIFRFIVPVLIFIGISSGFFLYKTKLKNLVYIPLSDKLQRYRTAVIIRDSLFEAPSLVAIIVTFLTGNYFYLIYTIVIIVLFLYLIPTKEKIIFSLSLSQDEIAKLEDPNFTI